MTSDRRNALGALTAAGLLWGLTVPLSKLALGWLDAGWLTVLRFSIAAPLLALVARGGLRGALTGPVVLSGAVGYGLVILVQNAGLAATSVSHAALIVGVVPALVALIAAATGRASGGPLGWLGAAAALGGVALIAGAGGSGTTARGDALVLASVTLSAAFIVGQPRLLAGRDPAAVTAVQLAAAAVAALPHALLLEGTPPAPAGAGVIAETLALGVAGTLLPFWLFAYGQARVTPELAGAFVNLEPLVGAVAGAVAFHDAFGATQLAGGAAIVAGIALGARTGEPSAAPLPNRRARRRASVPWAGDEVGRAHRSGDAGRLRGRRRAAAAAGRRARVRGDERAGEVRPPHAGPRRGAHA